jgi:K+-transporting ATPase KdpF subunit
MGAIVWLGLVLTVVLAVYLVIALLEPELFE